MTLLLVLLLIHSSEATSPGSLGDNKSDYNAVAQQIYAKLQEAVGDKKSRWPKLTVWSIENRGAVYVPADHSIYLDEKVIQSCMTFGDQMDDALSFVIAHEMTHFYQSHQWKEAGLVRNFMVSSEAFETNRQHEAQADIYGAFLSYQAGYNTLGLIPDLLDRIYDAYGLDSAANVQYPSLENRKKLALEACDLASNLIEIYQTANYLLVLGKFETAYPLYKHVEKSIQFKEVHYNIGLCSMMAYLHLKQIELKYPLALDSRTPIQRGLINRSPQSLLEEARKSFELVTEKYDPYYIPAKTHLISVYDWLGEKTKAEAFINFGYEHPKIEASEIFQITVANYYARQGKVNMSQDIYQSLLTSPISDSNYIWQLARHNQYIIQGNKIRETTIPSQLIKNEKGLDGVSSLVFYQDFQQNLHIQHDLKFLFGHEYNSSVTKVDFGKVKFTMQRIHTAQIRSSTGLGIGNSLRDIENQTSPNEVMYGKHVNGNYLIIYNQGLIFKLNSQGIIVEWISFTI